MRKLAHWREELRRGAKLLGLVGIACAGMLGLTHDIAAAQVGELEPAEATPTNTGYQTYQAIGTPRPPSEKSADVVAHERIAFDQNKAACEAGDQSGCTLLGDAYQFGRGVAQVRPIAGLLFETACQSGNAEGCYRLGLLNRVVFDFADRPAATLDFRRACELGSSAGCLELAIAYKNGNGLERNPAEAESLFRGLCEQRAGNACRELGRFLEVENPDEAATLEAIGLYIQECEAGDAWSCNNLTNMGVGDDPHPALPHPARVLYLGCLAADATACSGLGDRAMLGSGVVRDEAYGLMMYDRACSLNDKYCEAAEETRKLPALTDLCNSGDFAACAQVGAIYGSGQTVFSNDESAFNFSEYACENRQYDACDQAGIAANALIYAGSSQMVGRAQSLFEAGCEQGEMEACRSLADGLRLGETMPQDRLRSYELYAMLCENDDPRSCDILEDASREETDIPLALARAIYEPPRTEEQEEAFRRRRIEEQAAKTEALCDTNAAEFRGRVYSDRICDPVGYVLNGYELRPGQAPWQALLWRPERVRGVARTLQAHERVLCGGAVIQRGWILTAAHCLTDQGGSVEAGGYRVRLGVHNPRENEGVSYPIISVYQHDLYDLENTGYRFDIGLIRYDADRGQQMGDTNSITRAVLDNVAIEDRVISRRMPAYVYGWGLTGYRTGTSTAGLRGAELQLFSLNQCTRLTNYRGEYLHSALCASGAEGQQACTGDSGGPLVYYGDADEKPRVIAVVSSGFSCGTTGIASRFTRVAAARDWIDRVMSGRE